MFQLSNKTTLLLGPFFSSTVGGLIIEACRGYIHSSIGQEERL